MIATDWLKFVISDHEKHYNDNLHIPLKQDGSECRVLDLFDDQKQVVAVVLKTMHEFLTCEDLSTFEPLRMIVCGQGGSGKSVVINTIVTVIRKLTGVNDSVKVIAPTGVAACDVDGETFHHMFHMGVSKKEYVANNMPKATRLKLLSQFATLLAIIVDERSMVASKLLGTAERMTAETIFGGGHVFNDASWGGLPILILVGDDYQLPGIGEGPLTALYSRYGSKMVFNGREALLEASNLVVELGGSKRLIGSQSKARLLLDRLRTGNCNDDDIDKLLSLRVDAMKKKHGPDAMQEIEKSALYLFFRNERRMRHNLTKLASHSSAENPVAVVRSKSVGKQHGKGTQSHFDSDTPLAALLCIGAMIALCSRNFQPHWGLHNGAAGTVHEIIFEKGDNPNNGDLPLCVVVDFPNCSGPAWDVDNPTVRT